MGPEKESKSLAGRVDRIERWLFTLPELADHAHFDFQLASGDASFRRYFRLSLDDKCYIVMDAPRDREDCRPFVKVARILRNAGINAPQIIAQDIDAGLLLLSDLGDKTYLEYLESNVDPDHIYRKAIDALVKMQKYCTSQADDLPQYDEQLLLAEMNLFGDWLLDRHLGVRLDGNEKRKLENVFRMLCDSALLQERVFVHRDYHSRNLMYCEPLPGVLDFQDAVIGPQSYDLVSLLKDCYLMWPRRRVCDWVDYYFEVAAADRLPVPQRDRFMSDFELMGVQRHLKASGIFARLWHRDGKRGYLADVPNTLAHIVALESASPDIRFLQGLITDRVLPLLESHP